MSLKAVYERFLSSPTPLALSQNATLRYITTLTTITQPGPIIKHLDSQNKQVVKKRAEKVIGVVEGNHALSVDVETTLEFISGGGSYLPGLENFVTDKVATLPMNHTVYFDHSLKIEKIRVSWDQGTLLQQVDVIGSRGKNWPIYDGINQCRLISSASPTQVDAISAAPAVRGRDQDEAMTASRDTSPSKKYMKDPHASLDVFDPPEPQKRESHPAAVATRVSAKPPPREMSDLFAAGREDLQSSTAKPDSPSKSSQIPVVNSKGANGQKFHPSRLFDDEPEHDSRALYKSNPAKYDHFNLGEAVQHDHFQHKNDAPPPDEVPIRSKGNKQLPQWAFEDFDTPEKIPQKVRGQDVRHFGWSEKEGELGETPARQSKSANPRPDVVQRHFDFQDDITPVGSKAAAENVEVLQNRNSRGMYQDNIYDDGGETLRREKHPLGSITNTSGRRDIFENHWNMADASPATGGTMNNENKPIEQKKKTPGTKPLRKEMESNWALGELESTTGSRTNGKNQKKGIWDF